MSAKFAVTIEEIVRHTVVLSAANADEARAKAEELLLDGQMEAFQTDVTEREFVGCELTA